MAELVCTANAGQRHGTGSETTHEWSRRRLSQAKVGWTSQRRGRGPGSTRLRPATSRPRGGLPRRPAGQSGDAGSHPGWPHRRRQRHRQRRPISVQREGEAYHRPRADGRWGGGVLGAPASRLASRLGRRDPAWRRPPSRLAVGWIAKAALVLASRWRLPGAPGLEGTHQYRGRDRRADEQELLIENAFNRAEYAKDSD
jgi:hypothetical protein